MGNNEFASSIYKKIIHTKTGGGTQDDVIRRLSQNGSIGVTLNKVFKNYDNDYLEGLFEKNYDDICEVHRIVKEYVCEQEKTYNYFKTDVIDDILCPTFDLTREEILFLANTEPFQKFD